MKIKEKKELHLKSINELNKLLKEAHSELLTLMLDKEQNKLKNTSSLSNKRREIAVIKTVVRIKKEVVNG
jgi:ribosomal protein L29